APMPIPWYRGGYAQTIRGADDADYHPRMKSLHIEAEACMSDMMTRIAVVAAVVTGSATLASAQDFDPSGANRGYPQYAVPGGVHYYGGQLQGSRPGPVTVAPLRSVQAGLHRNVTAV